MSECHSKRSVRLESSEQPVNIASNLIVLFSVLITQFSIYLMSKC